jgi:drug/metabolite transporter (DMT)-like permease
MTNLLLAIVFSCSLFIVLKSFSKFNINTFQAIVVNYLVAFSIGILNSNTNFNYKEILAKEWIYGSLFLGFLFIVVFFIIGKTSQKNGVSVASVASKMSLIIPILFGIFFFKESIDLIKIAGIIIALIAVFFTTKKEKGTINTSNFTLPILLFIGTGITDTSINFIQKNWVNPEDNALFSSITFLFAFTIGLLLIIIQSIKKRIVIAPKNILGGIVLGVPNFFSIYFLLNALQSPDFESATLFTLLNIGVILLTTIFGLLLFKEKLNKNNYLGILLAILALFLVTY